MVRGPEGAGTSIFSLPIIAEKFNTDCFAGYKEKIIELLQRVCTMSVQKMEIVRQMESGDLPLERMVGAYEEGRRLAGTVAGPSFGLAHLAASRGDGGSSRVACQQLGNDPLSSQAPGGDGQHAWRQVQAADQARWASRAGQGH